MNTIFRTRQRLVPCALALLLILPLGLSPAGAFAASRETAAKATVEPADAGKTLKTAQAALDKGDYPAVIGLLTPLAEAGNAEALYVLGRLRLEGKGVKKNEQRAAQLFSQAAEKGDISAQNAWATALARGQGTRRNYTEAARWFRKAAEQGLAEAQYNLGYLYAHGRGVKKDENAALDWYGRAANQGLADAQANLEQLMG